MHARINTLAQLMKLNRDNDRRFVLMLGAGASLSSGIKPTAAIMQELLDRFGKHISNEGDLMDRFDVLWDGSTEDQRRMFLTPYLDREPSSGYLELARLVQEGYFDLVINFNYDDLLRKAFRQIGFTDFHQVIRGETEEAKLARLVESPVAKCTILKMHGSLFSTNTFLFDRREMLNYPKEVEALFGRLTSRDIIVCGYAFNDICVTRAFSTDGGSVFWVNPSGAPSSAKGFLLNRKSKDYVITNELGMFDRFFSELSAEFFAPDAPPPEVGQRTNPFKFLESFDRGDRKWFFGREALTQEILDRVGRHPGSLHLIGASKAGKTSLVRAGVLAELDLDPAHYEGVYLRCRADLEEQLREELALRLECGEALELGPGFERLAEKESRHLVVVLDQFERVVRAYARSADGAERLAALLRNLGGVAADRVTFLFVVVDESEYYKLMWTAGLNPPHVRVMPLPADEAMAVVERQASQAGLRFDPDILETLRGKFRENVAPDGTSPFTLAHLQTICYLLALRAGSGRESYASLIGTELESSLDSVIRDCDVMNFVEDFPAKQERKLLRVIMKIVSEPSRRIIAAHIRDRFADLVKDSQYPEPF